MNNNILEFLRSDGNFTTNKKLVKKVGLINATVIQEIISYSFYAEKQGYYIENGYFMYTKKNIQEVFNLSRRECENAFDFMKKNNMITEIKKGMPQKTYLRLSDDIIMILSDLMSNNEHTVVSDVTSDSVQNDTNSVRNDTIQGSKLHFNNNNTINNTINNTNIEQKIKNKKLSAKDVGDTILFFKNDCANFGIDFEKITTGLDDADLAIQLILALEHYKTYSTAKIANWIKNTNRADRSKYNLRTAPTPEKSKKEYYSKANVVDCGF